MLLNTLISDICIGTGPGELSVMVIFTRLIGGAVTEYGSSDVVPPVLSPVSINTHSCAYLIVLR